MPRSWPPPAAYGTERPAPVPADGSAPRPGASSPADPRSGTPDASQAAGRPGEHTGTAEPATATAAAQGDAPKEGAPAAGPGAPRPEPAKETEPTGDGGGPTGDRPPRDGSATRPPQAAAPERPAEAGARPAGAEAQPAGTETSPGETGTRPTGTDTRPAGTDAAEAAPAPGASAPAAGETAPEASDPPGQTAEERPADDRPASEEQDDPARSEGQHTMPLRLPRSDTSSGEQATSPAQDRRDPSAPGSMFTPVIPAKAARPPMPPPFGASPPPQSRADGPGASPETGRPSSQQDPGRRTLSGAAKKVVIAAASVVAVAAIGTGAFLAYGGPDEGTARSGATSSAAPATTEPEPEPTGPDAKLDSETTDPNTLTLNEAFPETRVTVAGRTFRRVKVHSTDECDQAATGAFATALAEQHCRRVLRATYVDRERDFAVTTGIAVLPTKEAALTVDRAKDLGRNVWFRGLNGKQGSGAERMEIAGGYGAGLVWGRYIVFSYATYSDGRTPGPDDTKLAPVSGAFRDHTTKVIEKRLKK